jgi:hypothetical protein
MTAMDLTLTRFVAALRHADVRVSPAETLDGLAVARHVGLADPPLLRDALALTLAKSPDDKARFAETFDRFFRQLAFGSPAKATFFRGVDRERLLGQASRTLAVTAQRLVADVLGDRRAELALRVEEAAAHAGTASMAALRDKGVVAASIAEALGLPDLESFVRALPAEFTPDEAHALRYVRSYVNDEIHRYVDAQYRIRVDATGRRAILASALDAQLNHVPRQYEADIEARIRLLAERLKRGRRRARRTRSGQLDVKRTMRANIAYGEALFELVWRRKKRTPATVFALCDVSASVARISRFLLLMLYELADVLPEVRTFAFSNRLGEITRSFRDKRADVAIEAALFDWGKGATDYGRAWTDFRDLAIADVDHKSTVIILGDARNNFFDPRADRFADIAHRAGRVIWLNPEPSTSWGDGDSEMKRFAPHCWRVWRLGSLDDLTRIAESLTALR